MKTDELHSELIKLDYLEVINGKEKLTNKVDEIGGEIRNFRGKDYFAWDERTKIIASKLLSFYN